MFPVVTAFAALIVSGAVHGLWTDRWKWSDEPDASANRLKTVPLRVGDWQGEDLEDKKGTKVNGIAGTLYRSYVGRDGRPVSVFIVCGRPGPVAVHTPNDCYVAAGYEMLSQARCTCPTGEGTPPAELWTAQFRKTQAADQTYLRIYWTWSAAGAWQAPDDPRFEFGRHRYPALFKMYVFRELTSPDEPAESDPCMELLKQLLPEMQRSLFPSMKEGAG
jgi:hypothetical protein